jgi:hypothetical protein
MTKNYFLTKHAATRFQQRGFHNEIVELVLRYGIEKRALKMRKKIYITQKVMRHILRDKFLNKEDSISLIRHYDKLIKTEVIVKNNQIITLMCRRA